MFYDECLASGVLDVLRDVPAVDEILFVIQGAKPGVYTKRCDSTVCMTQSDLLSRLNFLIDGLAWRGGVVATGNGTQAQGKAQFNIWKSQGVVEVLPSNAPHRDF